SPAPRKLPPNPQLHRSCLGVHRAPTSQHLVLKAQPPVVRSTGGASYATRPECSTSRSIDRLAAVASHQPGDIANADVLAAQPHPLTRLPGKFPTRAFLRYKTGRPADSAYRIVFDRPSVTCAIRGSVFFGNMPGPAKSTRFASCSRSSTPIVGE